MAKKKQIGIEVDEEANGVIDDNNDVDEVFPEQEPEEYLCFVKFVGETVDGLNEYEFFFTTSIADVWGDYYDETPAGIIRNITPFTDTYDKVVKCKLPFKLGLVQDNTQFSMQDCHDGCCALAWEDISDYETYPEYRMILNFGDEFNVVDNKFAMKNVLFDL